MVEKTHIIRPSVMNSVLPSFLRALLRMFLLGLLLFIVGAVLSLTGVLSWTLGVLAFWILFGALVLAFLSVAVRIVILLNTTYEFSASGVVSEFRLFIIRRHAAQYALVTNVRTRMNVWDRLSRAGNIVLSTGDDDQPDLVLRAVKNPLRVEKHIRERIAASRMVPEGPRR